MTMRISAVACLAVALAGCATDRPAPPMAESPASQPAAATIFGQGAYRTSDGGGGSCAGFSVALTADTPVTRARMAALYGSTERAIAPVNLVKSRSAQLGGAGRDARPVYTAQCDARGAFTLPDLVPGSYFVIARVLVSPPRADGARDFVIMRAIRLRAGEVRELTLAP